MFSRQPWIPLACAALFGVSAASPAPQASACLATLADPEGDAAAAVECLVAESAARGDTLYKPLFEALFNGLAMSAPVPGGRTLVLADDEVAGPDDEYAHPVRRLLPYTGEPLSNPDGSPVLVPADSLLEPDVGRSERALLQPELTAFGLYSPDPVVRREAARQLGEAGDAGRIASLRAARDPESGRHVLHTFDVAIARIGLRHGDPAARLEAVASLRELKATAALAELEAVAADDSEDEGLRTAAALAAKSIRSWMGITEFVQNLFSGLSLGSILILMALGLAVIFGLMGVINMAHGEFMMIGAYATFVIQGLFAAYAPGYIDWFLPLSFPAAFLAAALFGMLVEATVIRHLYGRPLETLLATWGVSLVLIQLARTLFGDLTSVRTPAYLAGGWEVVPQLVFPYNRLSIIVLTIVIVSAMLLLFYRTPVGMKVRAVTQNRAMSACLGVRTRRLDSFTFGLGTGIAGIAGCALTQIGNVSPGLGQNYIVDSFMVVVTGGVGKLAGTVLAGLGIGSLNKFLEPVFQAVYAKVILLALVILFLQWRPSGIFPAKGRHEDN